MKSIKVGLVGFGTIGKGVYELLIENSKLIKEKAGIDIAINAICDIRINYLKKNTNDIYITDKWEDLINNREIDIIIELIGGLEPAKTVILSALKKGKSVVTANKKLLAEDGIEIFETAGKSSLRIGFEGAVGGGIPCILALKSGLVGNKIRSVMGILNGTTNYILTKMTDMGLPFTEVLKEAQDKGFAEADPSFDVEGFDAGHKIALLAMLSYNKKVNYKSIPIEGITRITDLDISHAKDMGYTIKLLGSAKMVDNKLDISVHPTMIPLNHPLSSVRNEFNAVMFDGDMTDPVILYGKGAGSKPTASAIVSDIIQIAEKNGLEEIPIKTKEEADYILPENKLSRYYLRIHTEDSPGILSKISGTLGKFNISIASVIQKEVNTKYVPLIIMTHHAHENEVLQAVEEISNFNFIDGQVMLIRVEDSLYPGDNI